MISIRQNLTDLERCHQARDTVLGFYVEALRNAALYAVEVDGAMTAQHRKHLNDLADAVAGDDSGTLSDSRATVRGLLRDYHDRAGAFLARLRDELAGTARALEEITESLSPAEDDVDAGLRGALGRVRAIAMTLDGPVEASLSATAAAIEQGLEQIRKRNQFTVSQFRTEIRVLHQRIDAMQAAASVDDITKLLQRPEMENRIRSNAPGSYCLLLVKAEGIRLTGVRVSREAGAELAGAFAKRLKNSLPEESVVCRWGEEDFVALLEGDQGEAFQHGKYLTEHLGGSYACLLNGKTVRPALKVRVGVVDSSGEKPERLLARIGEFLS